MIGLGFYLIVLRVSYWVRNIGGSGYQTSQKAKKKRNKTSQLLLGGVKSSELPSPLNNTTNNINVSSSSLDLAFGYR